MRYLITVVIAALSLNSFGQGIPQLPYNPDENGDGLIGVPDLQALLAQYGLEFNSAVLSEDAQSAIVYMGEMAHPVCSQACDNLPGFWHMATMHDLGLVWDEVISSSEITWVNSPKEVTYKDGYNNVQAYHHFYGLSGEHEITWFPGSYYRCYCAAHELPKVEYSQCFQQHSSNESSMTSFIECCELKVQDGWYPLDSNPTTLGDTSYASSQAFWRWAVE